MMTRGGVSRYARMRGDHPKREFPWLFLALCERRWKGLQYPDWHGYRDAWSRRERFRSRFALPF